MSSIAAQTGVPDHVTQLGELADRIVRVARKIEVHRFQDPDITQLSSLEAMLLRYVDDHPGISPKQIAADLIMQGSNVSAGVRGLQAKGLVTKTLDLQDARYTHLRVTAAAREGIVRVRAEWGVLLEAQVPADTDVSGAVRLLALLDSALK
jgi:DNA-binding MarR family transcriptional regulator